MKIVKAHRNDLQEILDLQYLAYQSEARLFHNSDIPPLKQVLDDVMEEYQKGIILKAVDETQTILGSVRGYFENGTVYIGKLIVHPDHQGQGIGTKLLIEAEKKIQSSRYELFTSSKSKKNIALYERLGYKPFTEKQITPELKFVYLEKLNM